MKKQEKAYAAILTRIKDLIDIEALSLHEAMEQAKETVVLVEEITQEEVEEIMGFIRRDIHGLRDFLKESGANFQRWLRFDVNLIENKLWETFSSIADPSRVALLTSEWKNPPQPYQSGEITGPGTLVCTACDTPIVFHSIAMIPSCEKCQGTQFSRTLDK